MEKAHVVTVHTFLNGRDNVTGNQQRAYVNHVELEADEKKIVMDYDGSVKLMTSYKNKEGLFEPDAITLRIGDATDPFDNGAGNEAKIVKTDSGKEYTISKEDARNCTVSAGELKRKVAVAATPAQ